MVACYHTVMEGGVSHRALASCSRSFQSHPSLQSQAGYGALCFKPARFLSLSTASAAATTTRQKQQQRPKGPSSQDPTPKPPRLLRTWTEGRKVPSTSTGSKLQVKPAPSLRERTAEVLADEGMPLETFYLEEQDSQDEEEEEEEEEDYEYADHHSSSEDAQHRKMQSLPDFESMDLNCQHFKRGTVVDVSGGFSDICKGGQLDESCQSSTCIIEQGGHDPNAFFCRLLQECIVNQDWTAGRRVHALIILSGLEVGNFLGSHLIRMYVSCASLAKANQVFIKLSRPNNFTWNSIISAHTKLGQAKQAIKLYFQLCQSSMEPDGHIFVAVLKACAITAAFAEGMVIHGHVFEGSFESDVFIVNSLISMYAQRGSLKDARKVFDKYSRLELVTWSVMIGEYTKQGQGHEAFKLYLQMQQRGIKPDNVIFSIVFNACSSVVDIEQCKLVHGHYIESGLESDTYVENTLLDMYAKCGSLEDAHEVFTISRHRDVVTWSGMISGYAQHGRFYEALQLFQQMQDKGLEPNHFTFACTLKACSNLGDLSHGKLIHAHIIHSGFDFDVFIKSTLIDMYAKCGSLEDAHGVFDKMSRRGVVEWSAMMSGYAMHRHGQEALQLNQLMQEEGIHLDKITLINMIKACTSASALGLAKLIHAQIAESHFECDGFIGASLIDVYAKCGTLEDARTVFNQMPDKDLVIWGAMMTGYADAEMGHEVLHLFQNLHKDGIEPNCIAVVCALKACSSLATLDQGKLIHYCVMESGCESGCESDVFAGSSLIDMYSKCGSLRDACRVFERLPRQNVVTWTAMIGGCAHHNEYKLALQYFKEMQQEGLKPDGQTFTCLLTACNHVGLVEDSRLHLISMEGKHGVAPIVDHYNCVADILGRVGCVKEAKDLLQTKTHSNNIVGWMSLLSHCRTYGNIEEGRQCFDHVMGTEP